MNFKKLTSILILFSFILLISASIACAENIDEIESDDSLEIDNTQELTQSSTIYISPEGTGSGESESDPTNWNNALYNSQSGDTIQFANGTYKNVKGDINKDLNLKGSGETVLDAEKNDGFLTIGGKYSKPTVTLSDMSFVNAYTGKTEGKPDGAKTGFDGQGAIVNGGNLIIKNCYFGINQGIGTKGGAIHNAGTCHVYSSTFFNNGGEKGGAFYSQSGSELYLYDCIVNKCISKEGSAVHAKEAYVEIHNCRIENSSAKNGLFYVKESTVKIYDTRFYNSKAVDAAGVINIDKKSTVEIDNCTFDKISSTGTKLWFHDEYGSGDGGVIVVEKDALNVLIKNSRFINCSAKGYGGVLYINSQASITIDNCTFKSNNAGFSDNIYSTSANIKIMNSLFEVKSTINTSNIKSGQSEIINVTVDDGTNNLLNVKYTIFTNNQEYDLKSNTLILYNLKPGNYNATLIARDSNQNRFEFTQSTSSYMIYNEELKVNVTYQVNDDGSVDIKLTDEYGNPVAGREVTVNVDGANSTLISDGNGSVKLTHIHDGEHNISVTVPGLKVDNSKPVKLNVVNKTGNSSSIITYDVKRAQYSPYDFKALLFDKNGEALKNKKVNIIVNGNDNEITTDNDGYAYLKNKLGVGSYTVTVENPATGEKLTRNCVIVSRFTMNRDITVDYTYTANYKLCVFSDDGKAVGAGETVKITVNGKTTVLKTDSKGIVTFKISKLLPKTYTLTADYKGIKVSNKIVVKHILKAKNMKYKRYKVKKFTATLKTSSGKAIKGKKITFKVNGKKYTAKTNKKGVATIKIKGLYKIGKHKIRISYLKSTILKTVTVKR